VGPENLDGFQKKVISSFDVVAKPQSGSFENEKDQKLEQ